MTEFSLLGKHPFNQGLFLSYFSWCVFNECQRVYFTLKFIHVDSPVLIEFESPQHLPLSSSWSWVVYLWPPRITISGLLGVGEKGWDWIGCLCVSVCVHETEKESVSIFLRETVCACVWVHIYICLCVFFAIWLWFDYESALVSPLFPSTLSHLNQSRTCTAPVINCTCHPQSVSMAVRTPIASRTLFHSAWLILALTCLPLWAGFKTVFFFQ